MSPPSALRCRAIVGGVVRPDVVITVGDGRITSVGRGAGGVGVGWAEPVGDGLLLAPGFIDIHIHGAGGASVTDGPDAIRHVARTLAARGVTSFLPTAVSAPLDRLAAFTRDVAAVMRQPERDGAAVLGANLEGPALDPDHAGAHDRAALLEPADVVAAFRRDRAVWAPVRVVTLAPERRGGLELVRLLAARGIVASIGHSGATFSQAVAAYDDGARSTTHLFNAMSGLAHRAPGMALAALLDPRAAVELIADGLHVDRAFWPLVRRLAGPRLILVSDALPAAGVADPLAFRLGELDVIVRDGRATLADGTLAGSLALLPDGAAQFVDHGASLAETVAASSTRPARLLGDRARGRIARGARADLIALRPDGSVARVWLGGREVPLLGGGPAG